MKGSCWTNVKKILQWIKKDNLNFIVMLLWPRWNYDFGTRYEVWPLIKVEVSMEYNKLYFWTRPQFNSKMSQTVAQLLIQCCFGFHHNFPVLNRQQWVDRFATFWVPNSYGSSIGVLNMSWSTLCCGNNEASLIKFGVDLDLRS